MYLLMHPAKLGEPGDDVDPDPCLDVWMLVMAAIKVKTILLQPELTFLASLLVVHPWRALYVVWMSVMLTLLVANGLELLDTMTGSVLGIYPWLVHSL